MPLPSKNRLQNKGYDLTSQMPLDGWPACLSRVLIWKGFLFHWYDYLIETSSDHLYPNFGIRKITCKLYVIISGQKFGKYLMKYYVILLIIYEIIIS